VAVSAKHGDVWRSACGKIELRCGDYRDVLADVDRVDAVITDPPYSDRTHAGHDAGLTAYPSPSLRDKGRSVQRRAHEYAAWSARDVAAFAECWMPRTNAWMVAMCDHVLAPSYEAEADSHGRYSFAPIVAVTTGSRFRALGDGPPCWCVWLMISRPKRAGFFAWGALPGAYVLKNERDMLRVGGKPLSLMRAIVRDYTRPGDLVCDPCAGGGTTLLAAAVEGRRAIGAELDPETFDKAVKRLERGYTPLLDFGEAAQ